jgi:hypothetical protein
MGGVVGHGIGGYRRYGGRYGYAYGGWGEDCSPYYDWQYSSEWPYACY